MFSKSLNELTREDIVRVTDEKVQESAEVEFKETLPARNGLDPWMDGAGSLGDYARNKILEEVIALANTYGGTLLVGIAETKDKPPRADHIEPIPRCVELAERLRMQCRDCIEPQVPHLDAQGVVTEDDGLGVVVVRVPKSRMAPHRHTINKECYIRRSDRSETMTMREIQDLTLHVERGLAGIERKFGERRAAFAKQFGVFFPATERGFGARATLMPLDEMYIPVVHDVDAVRPMLRQFSATLGNDRPFNLFVPLHFQTSRPIIRGTLGEGGDNDLFVFGELHCDGLVEYGLLSKQGGERRSHLHPTYLMGLVGNALCAVERFRRAAGAPDIEFGLEFEICINGPEMPVPGYGSSVVSRDLGHFPKDQTIFPRYSVGAFNEFASVTALLENDFWNAAGCDWDQHLEIDYARALS